MNAIEPTRPPLQSVPQRAVPRTQRQQRRHPNRGTLVETTAKLTVNIVLSSAAISALAQLLPYHMSQQAKLSDIQEEVKRTEKRVNRLSDNFRRYFDPQQAKSVMQEQSHRVDPSQRQVVLMDSSTTEEEELKMAN
ncbi:hypothetical protein NDI37_26305 [Funiculus sociatus GB2-A5]|uniref:Uncharacterized protein n=2 Tax=Cyanobacteriota TaxID=1117 RepID=A0ABV0JX25_9CYAN|nr:MULTISPECIES: hypothetical protein [unclassified Trichocoleus]MBD1907308.1 hypothetical protein [Trichocoleus sp. FACHB-832]MBD1930548.1 hypothetical protein [Trichocoleus sp. FACHB-69]MBD2004057.1 hypothetical protein [Trichocoleus sp. FACHB-40]MBD2063098.1 hypothetical protein [Trichocoleus sp. FACHB-6]